MSVRLAFHGAASTVTGSCFLLQHRGGRILVDCGLFQGTKTVRELNYGAFPFAPQGIDQLVLTHAHTDHAGLVPKLVKAGFSGPVIATEPTRELLRFMLPDSGAIQEMEVERLNARNRKRGQPLLEPIYTAADAERALERCAVADYGAWFALGQGARGRFWNAGHILGSASVEIELAGEPPLRLLFSGDIGPDEKSFHAPPEAPEGCDVLIVESTYGDRDREDVTLAARRARLKAEIEAALGAGGNLLIPAFAVERTQELLCTILDLMRRGEVRRAPVFVDSPLAIRATEVFTRYQDDFAEEPDLARLFAMPELRPTLSAEDSKAINRVGSGAIIIAGSGMCEAGRIRHHLKQHLWRRDSTVLFVGYQAAGTLGQLIQSGEEKVRIHTEEIAVRARIRTIDGFSAHADQRELLAWVAARRPVRDAVFLVHGEPPAMATLRAELAGLGLVPERVLMPGLDAAYTLRAGHAPRLEPGPSRLPADAAAKPADWHNAYARLLLDLARELQAVGDDGAREALLAELRAVVDRRRDGPGLTRRS